ncbi:hypothetical protein BDB00DRAFT_459749 [Zychaea mexicana]|uniref:uncharacterized protein n=1 Tax=Zychaea mexicana TaxID=64656 RepID=UPI0022FE7711|nr:uncharacterized protein BDB00DRAFT_459749 [Zychaea mexicana]KAI9492061.1 hypothetical protein BDB00DRAFT_459749 [Zychaea mexicana]
MSRLVTLPPEVLDSIFRYFSVRDRWQFSAVCHSWRSVMMHWHGMWEQLLTSDYKSLATMTVAALSLYKDYVNGAFVKRVWANVHSEYNLPAIIDFLKGQKCNTIVEVGISAPYMAKSSFLQLAEFCARTLTRLSFTFSSSDTNHYNPSPDDILHHCQSLKSLYYTGPVHSIRQWKTLSSSSSALKKHKHLVDLALNLSNSDGSFEARRILAMTPHIQRLRLGLRNIKHTSATLIPGILRRHCRELVTLVLHSHSNDTIDSASLSMDRRTVASSGLENLVFHDSFDQYCDTRQVVQLLAIEYCQSLYSLDIKCGYRPYSKQSTMERLSSVIFPCLCRFILNDRVESVLKTRPTESHRGMSRFLAYSVPNLTHLDLTCFEGGMELASFATNAKRLHTLNLSQCTGIDSQQLTAFFTALSRQDDKRTRPTKLVSIKFCNMPSVSTEVLLSMASSPLGCGLKELTIDHCENVTLDDIDRFLDTIVISGRRHFMIHKLNINLVYYNDDDPQEAPHPFPDRDKVNKMLRNLDSRAMEWTFSLTRYFELSMGMERHDHMLYRKRLLCDSQDLSLV